MTTLKDMINDMYERFLTGEYDSNKIFASGLYGLEADLEYLDDDKKELVLAKLALQKKKHAQATT